MNRVFKEEMTFEKPGFQNFVLETGDYEKCIFKNCDFSNTDFSDINFLECEFRECNLSLVRLVQTSFRDVKFINCKLLGLHLEDCNSLMMAFTFEGCTLDLCSFNKLKLKKTIFKDSKITEVDFTETDLTSSSFINCDLTRTIFETTNLEGVDFSTSFNYSIHPCLNRVKRARFSLSGITGLLDKFGIEIEE